MKLRILLILCCLLLPAAIELCPDNAGKDSRRRD